MAIYKFKICNFVKEYFYSIEFLHLQVHHVIISMQSIRLFQQILWDEVISPGNSQCIDCLGTYQIQLSTRVAEKTAKAAFPCMRTIYPTDFVCTDFSRTDEMDEMPYKKKKKTVSMLRIFIRFSLLFTCGKQKYTCRKQGILSLK